MTSKILKSINSLSLEIKEYIIKMCVNVEILTNEIRVLKDCIQNMRTDLEDRDLVENIKNDESENDDKNCERISNKN